ncbi:MAG: efflux RND transporter permease subunit [Mangrovibacterium sp.]
MNLIRESIRHRQLTLSIIIMIIAYGIYALCTMPRREDPKIIVNEGLIIAYYPGANAEQVEAQLSAKIEDYLFKFEGVRKSKTFTRSIDGLMIAHVVLEDQMKNNEIFWNKLRHELLIAKTLELPSGIIGPIVTSDFSQTEAMLISISANKENYVQLKEYAQRLGNEVRKIDATSKLTIIGEQKQEISIKFNSSILAQYQLSLQQIISILQSQNALSSGGSILSDELKSTIHVSGYYPTIEELEQQIIAISDEGHELHLSDIAEISRSYAEPNQTVWTNGCKSILLAIQMNDGNNIVQFGKQIDRAIAVTKNQIPSHVDIDVVFSQPELVRNAVDDFLIEFLVAIIAVIIVILLLLPLNIAAVAATSIPVTIAITFAILESIGVELHQVSLAALIVVLGLVVDDTIVVADNYVELLDRGIKRPVAAWQSASTLVVPIFTATITIIAAFLPIAGISGVIGDFIHDLPITVSISLAVSFIVSMLFTPSLCLLYIKKGLKNTEGKSRDSIFNFTQRYYEKILNTCMKHAKMTIMLSILTIVVSAFVFQFGVKQQFFPYAERNQFIIELNMPTGTKYDETAKAIHQLEQILAENKLVKSHVSFIGHSSPRVYYNFAPKFPQENFAQILVNTHNNKDAEKLAAELSSNAENLLSKGNVEVKLMQQGQPLESPVEVQIYGDDLNQLKIIGNEVTQIIKSNKNSRFVKNDFKDDYLSLSVALKPNASRLGFSTESVSKQLYVATQGASISTLYEGRNPVNLKLQSSIEECNNMEKIGDIYIQSPITNKSVPLRQIAEIKPEWHTAEIIRRNGTRCLTIGSETDGIYPSELLTQIRPQIENIKIPPGYFIEYGGEHFNKIEITNMLIGALSLSLILILITILFQFKQWKKVFMILSVLPLALLGAMLGLAITNNPFGFTAMMGLISLAGIVVRNAIILIEHADELIHEGMNIKTAAFESAKRRLRPILLTTISAAFGVIPMIISGSSLWAPLASVIAFGVIWSMFMTLLTIPVLYAKLIKK